MKVADDAHRLSWWRRIPRPCFQSSVRPSPAFAQTDPLTGTADELNAAKSSTTRLTCAIKSNTIITRSPATPLRQSLTVLTPRASATHTEYTAKLDGKTYPFEGTIGGKPNA